MFEEKFPLSTTNGVSVIEASQIQTDPSLAIQSNQHCQVNIFSRLIHEVYVDHNNDEICSVLPSPGLVGVFNVAILP
ncbi:TPA: hypothetical protein DEP21_06405 [Patescibacteria group bacterium]|nr:hypothetical protein [Candidatus Gracilibacteria bacterium]